MVKSLTNPFLVGPPPLGTLLTAAGRRLSAELDAALRAAGFSDVRAAHAPLFMSIEPEGCSVSTLAERARMTKQAAGELIRHLAEHGYLEIGASPADRRVRLVKLTDRGWEAVQAGRQVVADFDAWLDAEIGTSRVEQLRETLTMIADTARTGN